MPAPRKFPEWLIAEERQRRIHDSRLAPDKIPGWVPFMVLVMAQRLLAGDPDNAALILRLATDPRMKTVWDRLTRAQPTTHNLSKWTALIDDGTAPYPDVGFDPIGVFFSHAYFFARLSLSAGRATFVDVQIISCQIEAMRLRAAAAQLRKFNDESVSCHIQHIEEAAKFYDKKVAETEKLKEALAPAYIKRDHGRLRARGYVRMLAVEAKHLFGEIGYRTIATTAAVALAKEITHRQVTKWCASLD
jgi:hypothetical protein